MTPNRTLNKLILQEYLPEYTEEQIKGFINAVIDSRWLEHAGNQKVHLTESGVHMYWIILQARSDEIEAKRANGLAYWIKIISFLLLIVGVLTLVVAFATLIEEYKK